MNSPSERLAVKIVERLTKEHLISSADAEKFAKELAAGRLRPEDWRLAVEMAGDKKGQQRL